MKVLNKRLQNLFILSLLLVPFSASATNGYFLIGFGSKSRAIGGAGVAYGQDGIAAAANPATMADVLKGQSMRVDVVGELFYPRRASSHDSATLPAKETSGANLFLIPAMGGIYKFNRKMYIGMAAIGAGSNTRFHQDVPGRPECLNGQGAAPGQQNSYFFNFNCNADSSTLGVNLIQMQMLPSIAYKLNKQHTVGASLALAVQTFRAYGLGAFEALGFAASDSNVSGEGNDWSYGAGVRFGYQGKFFKNKFSVGANYASRVYMTKFDKYKNLFAEQGGFDIPEHFAFGIAIHPTKKLTIAGDIQRILFSNVRSVGNPGPTLDPNFFNPDPGCQAALLATGNEPPECKLGGDKGLGFGWGDATVYKVGMSYDYNSKLTLRLGFNYAKTPIKDDQILFNLLAPATVEKHLTLGASYRFNKNHELSFNMMHAFKNTVKGPTRFPPTDPVTGTNAVAGTVNNAATSMYQYSLGIGYGFSF